MLKKLTGLLTDSATYGISKVLAQLIGFFLLPLYTRYLAPADYGLLAMLAIVGTLFSPLAGLGMTSAVFRRYNLSKDETERQQVLGVGLSSVLVTSLLLLATSLFFSTPLSLLLTGSPEHHNLIMLILITASISTVGEIPRVILRARRQVRTVAVLNTVDVTIAIGLTIFFVVGLRRGVQGVVEANLIASAESLVLNILVNLRQARLLFKYQVWTMMLKYGLPFVPHRLLAFGLDQYGQYMVGTQLGLGQAGLYSMAMRVTAPISFIVGAIQQAWVPYKFQVHAEDPKAAEFFRSVTTYYVAVTCYLWVGVSVWGPEVLRLMTTAEFHQAIFLVPLTAFIPISQGYFYMFGTGIELHDDTRQMPLVSLSALICVILTSFWTVPTLGALGAALSTILGYLVMAAVAFRLARKRYLIQYDWRSIGLGFVLAGLLVLLDAALQGLPVWPRLALAGGVSLVFPIAMLLILFFSVYENERVRLALHMIQQKITGGASA